MNENLLSCIDIWHVIILLVREAQLQGYRLLTVSQLTWHSLEENNSLKIGEIHSRFSSLWYWYKVDHKLIYNYWINYPSVMVSGTVYIQLSECVAWWQGLAMCPQPLVSTLSSLATLVSTGANVTRVTCLAPVPPLWPLWPVSAPLLRLGPGTVHYVAITIATV